MQQGLSSVMHEGLVLSNIAHMSASFNKHTFNIQSNALQPHGSAICPRPSRSLTPVSNHNLSLTAQHVPNTGFG